MLKQRLLTAMLLIPLIVAAILLLPSSWLHGLLILVASVAAWEWMTIIGFQSKLAKLIGLLVLLLLDIAYQLWVPPVSGIGWLLLSSLTVWLAATVVVISFAHRNLPVKLAQIFHSPAFGYLMAVMILLPFILTAVLLRSSFEHGPALLLYVLVAVWLADTGGYFAGKRWGRHHLAKMISPNKTWEGVAGALVLTLIWAICGDQAGINPNLPLTVWLGLTVLTVLISIVGDLFESLFKRSHQVKDSGQLLPGHGGIMDRIDSLVAALPIFVVGLTVSGAH